MNQQYPYGFGNKNETLVEMRVLTFEAFINAFQVKDFTTKEPKDDQIIPFCTGKKHWGSYGKKSYWGRGLYLEELISKSSMKYQIFDHTRTCRLFEVGSPFGADETWPRMIITHPYLRVSDVSEKEIIRVIDPDNTGKITCETFSERYSFYYPGSTIMIIITDSRIKGFIEQMKRHYQNYIDNLWVKKGWKPL